MKVIKPVTLGAAQLVSSTAVDADVPVFSSIVDYPVGARVLYLSQVYESVQAPNVGHPPAENALYWALVGPTNRLAMFDGQVSTQTVADSPLAVVVATGLVNSLALLELRGSSVSVVGRDGAGGPVIYEAARELEASVVMDWYAYFFEPFSPLTEALFTDLPAYGNIHLEVSIQAPLASAACGEMVCGSAYFLGDAEYGGSVGITDYSRKTTTETGATRFQPRRFARRSSQRLWIGAGSLEGVYRLLAGLRATPCVWIGTEAPGFGPFTVYGWYRDFNIEVSYPLVNFCTLDIEGLT